MGCVWQAGGDAAFCTTTDALATSCSAGSGCVSGFFAVWRGAHAGRVVFVTADGHVRLIGNDGAMLWKTATPIPGASFPVLLPDDYALHVGAADGQLHAIDLGSGVEHHTVVIGDGTATVGSPLHDGIGRRIFVGTTQGRIHRVEISSGMLGLPCGNGSCDTSVGETLASCEVDCAVCGDGTCSPGVGETLASCEVDCAVCGDATCSPGGGETLSGASSERPPSIGLSTRTTRRSCRKRTGAGMCVGRQG